MLLGGILGEEFEDVLSMNVAAGTDIIHPDHVDAKLCGERLGNLTYRRFVNLTLEVIGERASTNVTIITVVARLGRIA